MILLWGTLDDEPMAMAHAALLRGGANCLFLNSRDMDAWSVDYAFDREGFERCILTSLDASVDMATVNVAYVRCLHAYDYDDVDRLLAENDMALQAIRFQAQLMAWLDASDVILINPSAPSATNNSKPYQMSIIEQAGFLIPYGFISNDPAAALGFLNKHPDALYKSISGIRSIVRRVEARHRKLLDDVQWCPTLFQSIVRGTNYRAHVLNGEVFAVRIESRELDYRYGSSTISATNLPAEIAERCRRLTATLGLHFSGIDLIRTPEDEWYCLEVNPSPAYSYFENASGQPLSNALASFMIEADEKPAGKPALLCKDS